MNMAFFNIEEIYRKKFAVSKNVKVVVVVVVVVVVQ